MANESIGLTAFLLKSVVRGRDPGSQSLREHDWAEFARRCNGPPVLRNGYVERLAAAYTAALAEFRTADAFLHRGRRQ
jgi:N-acetylmuramidase